MKKVTLSQETRKVNKYQEMVGYTIVMQPVDILLTTEKSKELLQNGKVLLENYKGKDILVTYSHKELHAYVVNNDNGFVMENGKVYKLEVVDNTQDLEIE